MSEFAAFDPHLVLLDVSLPFFNGYHWCQEIRRVSKAPILFLTSASDNVNVVMAMQLGGDDLLAKPFDLQVLSAKVQALLRRAYDFGPSSHLLSCGAAVLNVSDGTLDAHGQRVELTRNECRILQLLLEHKGEIVSRDASDDPAVGVRQLCGREHPDGEHRPAAAEAGGGGPARISSAPGRAPGIWWRGDGMLTAYLKRQWKLLLLLAGAVAVFAAVFALYSLPVEAVAYAGLLCLVLGLVLFALGYSAFLRRHRELEGLLRKVHESVLPLPPPRGVLEADYQALLRAVCADRVRLAAENRDRLEDMTDYYTLWAHQIKTPIAAARLLLQEDPGAVGTEVEVELLKIEQYVDMVLGYLRLDSESTDYVLRDTDLDGLLRQAVRKFARMFILKKITLDFRETGPDGADGREVALLRGGAGAVQRPEIHPRRGPHPDLRGRRDAGHRRQRHRYPAGGPAPGVREGLHRLQRPGGQEVHRHRAVPVPPGDGPAEPRNLHRLPPRAGDAGAAGPLPGPTGGGVTQCDETVRNRAGL